MKIAISAGHNKFTGAQSHNGVDEWQWNTKILHCLRNRLEALGHKVIILHRDKSLSYTRAMRKLGSEMKDFGAQAALELHFNSSAPSANGYEFLHWWRSSKSKLLAKSVADSFGKKFPRISARGKGGARSLWYHRWNEKKAYSGRGGAYCYLTPCPAIICEPGFASNEDDWDALENRITLIAEAYAEGVDDYSQSNNR